MVSVDKPEDNKGFAEKEKADFPILSDPEKTTARVYGVMRTDLPPERATTASRFTFYIGPDGTILFVDKGATGRGVPVQTAGADTIKRLEELGVKKKK